MRQIQELPKRENENDTDTTLFDGRYNVSKVLDKVFTGDLSILAEGESAIDLENNRRVTKINGKLYSENTLTEIGE
jgi:hypothetical protein